MTIGHEQNYQLRTGDFDRFAHLQPAAVLDIFQDIAGVSADATPGMGYDELRERGIFWAVARIRFEIVETPSLHEQVVVRTWPLAPTRVGFQREYTIRALDGRMLVKGTSEWVAMDFDKRTFVSILDVYDGPQDFSEEKNFDTRTRKLRDFEATGPSLHLRPGYTDIDVNGHVNNTKYANFALDALQPGAEERMRSFQIDYRHEVHEGQELDILTARGQDVLDAKGVDPDGNVCFACRFVLA